MYRFWFSSVRCCCDMFNQCSFVSYLYCVCDIKYIYLISVAIWIEFWFFDRICRFECPTKTFSNRNDKSYCMNKHRIVQNKTVAVWSVYNILIFASDFWHDMYSYLLSIYFILFLFSICFDVCVCFSGLCLSIAGTQHRFRPKYSWMNEYALAGYSSISGAAWKVNTTTMTPPHTNPSNIIFCISFD